MNTNDKSLADVQPGGRVRLGDQAERARFEAWNRANWPNLDLSRGPLGDYMQARVRSDWQLWQAALSAQPSPGGQGNGPWPEIDMILADAYSAGAEGLQFEGIARRAAVRATVAANTARQPEYLHGSDELRARVEGERAAYLEGLEEGKLIAARQPVGISADWVLGYLNTDAPEESREAIRNAFAEYAALSGARQPVGEPIGWYTEDHLTDRSATTYDRAVADRWRAKGWPVSPLYTAPTAQAVDLGQSIPSELAPVAAALKRFGDCAEDSGSEGCDIGRDWFDALTTIGLLSRTQRSPAVWTMTAEGERLLALIDNMAVGK
ncbi:MULTISPECIES: hypothetical protein [Stenotrophomonas]|uniref:hypothetical protein n=1 Tax=Stenotrophomonas TaxID=40323 RepID=UPI000DA7C2E4|nr:MULTISPECIES: hypothetical protein [Stenotrophomonas]